eukprot:786605_1
MADQQNWKGQLQTFCQRYSCSTPKYDTKQLLSSEWTSKCTVEYPHSLLTNDNHDTEQIVTTTSTKTKKKESEGAAAEQMLTKLKRILSPHILHIKYLKHVKKLQKSNLQHEMNVLESLFHD